MDSATNALPPPSSFEAVTKPGNAYLYTKEDENAVEYKGSSAGLLADTMVEEGASVVGEG